MKLLLADEKPAFRKFIRQILEMERDLEVVGEAADGEDVIWLTQQLKPDVVMLDIALPGLDGLEATRRIKASLPATKVIILSRVDGESYPNTVAKHGAHAFPLKSAPVWEFLSLTRPEARQRLQHREVANFARWGGSCDSAPGGSGQREALAAGIELQPSTSVELSTTQVTSEIPLVRWRGPPIS